MLFDLHIIPGAVYQDTLFENYEFHTKTVFLSDATGFRFRL